jgi:hypothetical protein
MRLLFLSLLLLVAYSTTAIEKVKEAILANDATIPLPKKPITPFEHSQDLLGYWEHASGCIFQIGAYNADDILQISDPAACFAATARIGLRGDPTPTGIHLWSPFVTGFGCTISVATDITCTNPNPKSLQGVWRKVGTFPLAASANSAFPDHMSFSGPGGTQLDFYNNLGFLVAVVNGNQTYFHTANGRIVEQWWGSDIRNTVPHWGFLSNDGKTFHTSLGAPLTVTDRSAPPGAIPVSNVGCLQCHNATAVKDCASRGREPLCLGNLPATGSLPELPGCCF